MIWLTWRQHRGEALGALTLVVIVMAIALTNGVPLHQADSQHLASFSDYQRVPLQFAAWLPFLPMLAGILVGVPLIAREFEHGTWQLVWTQSVTRTRWLASKLALVLAAVTLASVTFAAVVSWWFEPLAPHALDPERYNQSAPVFPAYVLVAVALGILAGAVLRRTIPAAALTVVGYLMVRIPVEFLLRPRFREPLNATGGAADGWVVSSGGAPAASGGQLPAGTAYHPADRYWSFQLIETGILLGITAVLLLFAWRVVVGRR